MRHSLASYNADIQILAVITRIYHINIHSMMNKLASIAKIIALAVAMSGVVSCGTPNNNEAAPAAKNDAKTENSTPTGLNIRYIDADSVTANYLLAKEFQELTLASVSKIENVRQARANEIQKMGQQIEQKARNNGYLSQTSYEGDMSALAKKQQDATTTLDNMQARAQQEMAQRQIELNDSLESFIKDYNKTKGYDAILFKAAGVYFNPALDITAEVIEGLNARYEKGHKNK